MGGARKWPENEATALSCWSCSLAPRPVGGARKWPENEATAMDWVGVNLWYV